MKALTLHQPYATAIALGIKTVETRSWRTSYRGPLAIHAGARPPRDTPAERIHGDYRLCPVGRFGWRLEGPGLPEYDRTKARSGIGLPLGAVVATATLVDCVPMVSWSPLSGPATWAAHMVPLPGGEAARMLLLRAADTAAEALAADGPLPPEIDATDQLPWGDFRPGRWAWLLADVQPLEEPVPCRGYQGLWNVELEQPTLTG